jgi:hypothetical protein
MEDWLLSCKGAPAARGLIACWNLIDKVFHIWSNLLTVPSIYMGEKCRLVLDSQGHRLQPSLPNPENTDTPKIDCTSFGLLFRYLSLPYLMT